MKDLILLSCLFIFAVSCNKIKNSSQDQDNMITISGDTIIIPDHSPVLQHVHTQTVSNRDYDSHYTTTGIVRAMEGAVAEVSAPFDGRVSKSYIHIGQKVSAGTPVFELFSPDYLETIKSFIQGRQEKQLAASGYNRQKDLLQHGVGSRKEFEEAEVALQVAEREYDKALSSLAVFNVEPEETATGKPLIVRSPIAGEIVKNNITVGQYLKSDGEPLAIVANLEEVWVVARVKENNISMISSADSVRIKTDACPGQEISGIVSYVGSMLDEQTRSVEVYVECKNHPRTLKPGMFVNVSFPHEISDAVVIPASAVLQEDDLTFVFVQAGKNKFVKRNISVTTGDTNELIVRSNLSANDIIITDGAVYLH